MNLIWKISLYISTSICIAAGQGLLSVYARGIKFPFHFIEWLKYSLLNYFLYGAAFFYIIGLTTFIILLHFFSVAQVAITITGLLIIMVFILNRILGQDLTALQYVGVLLAFSGLLMLNWKL